MKYEINTDTINTSTCIRLPLPKVSAEFMEFLELFDKLNEEFEQEYCQIPEIMMGTRPQNDS